MSLCKSYTILVLKIHANSKTYHDSIAAITTRAKYLASYIGCWFSSKPLLSTISSLSGTGAGESSSPGCGSSISSVGSSCAPFVGGVIESPHRFLIKASKISHCFLTVSRCISCGVNGRMDLLGTVWPFALRAFGSQRTMRETRFENQPRIPSTGCWIAV